MAPPTQQHFGAHQNLKQAHAHRDEEAQHSQALDRVLQKKKRTCDHYLNMNPNLTGPKGGYRNVG